MKEFTDFIRGLWADPLAKKALIALIVLLVIWILMRVLKRALTRYINDKDSRYRSRKLANFAGFLVAALAVVVVFSDNLSGLGVTLGVAGAGIAFALQEVIVSFAGWLAIITGNFFRTGDRIELGGIRGDVIDIGVLRSTLMETGGWVDGDLYNGRIVTVANSYVFKDPVFNFSRDFPFLWDEIKVPIRYGSDLKMARLLLETAVNELQGDYSAQALESWKLAVRKYLIEDARIIPMVTMVADENWVTFTVRYIVDFKMRRTTKNGLWELILSRMNETDGKVSIASAAIEIAATPEMIINLRNQAGQ